MKSTFLLTLAISIFAIAGCEKKTASQVLDEKRKGELTRELAVEIWNEFFAAGGLVERVEFKVTGIAEGASPNTKSVEGVLADGQRQIELQIEYQKYDDGWRVKLDRHKLLKAMEDSRKATALLYVTRLAGDLTLYEVMNGFPPTTAQNLRALVVKPTIEPIPRKWDQREENIERDPWGMDYRYEYPGKHNKKGFDVFSCGPDRMPGTADDIGNWEN